MITILAFRHLLVRKLRSLFLLLGFSLGVGVMIVLLSVGQAMLEQSRDVSLIGGGEVTVLPQGIDVEAMRTGGVSGMFFGIDRARLLTRQLLGGPRQKDIIRAVSPAIEGKLLYLRTGTRLVTVRAGAEVPSRARTVGSGLEVLSGRWDDTPEDSSYINPTRQRLYDELDRFHLPSKPDSSWGEWHYFNLVVSPSEWWYITYLIGGEVTGRKWGGQVLVTHRRPDGGYDRFTEAVPSSRIAFDTAGADLTLGENFVRQRNGVYHLQAQATGRAGRLRLDLNLTPAPNRYFPPVELRDDSLTSGYVVPGLVAAATGKICVGPRCRRLENSFAYHDHNWGVWRDVTWEWGAARGARLSLLYGGVYRSSARSPFFLSVLDSLGVKQVLRFNRVDYEGRREARGGVRAGAPARFSLLATRESDTLRLDVDVVDALGTRMSTGEFHRVFLQMRGRFALEGRLLGQTVSDSGAGFFETYVLP